MSIGHENSVFTTLNLVNRYWQVPLPEESKQYTAFSAPNGHYAFKKLPFDISGAPLTFQRLINSVFSGLIGDSVLAFLDDVIIESKDVETHLQKLEEVLNRVKSAGLRLKLTKCNFMKKQIALLGHVLDAEGIHTTPEKVTAVQNFPPPKDLKSLRSFLGLSRYYRSFLPNYSTITRPLNQLLRKDSQFLLGTEHETAFNQLMSVLTTAPTLA